MKFKPDLSSRYVIVGCVSYPDDKILLWWLFSLSSRECWREIFESLHQYYHHCVLCVSFKITVTQYIWSAWLIIFQTIVWLWKWVYMISVTARELPWKNLNQNIWSSEVQTLFCCYLQVTTYVGKIMQKMLSVALVLSLPSGHHRMPLPDCFPFD